MVRPDRLPFWWIVTLLCAGCASAPVVAHRQDATEHLVQGARSLVSPRPPSYSLTGDQADVMPQGSRVVIETVDHDPVRVITATVLKVEGDAVVLRTGVDRRLSRNWEGSADGGSRSPQNADGAPRVSESPFEELKLPLREVARVDVFLNVEQPSWRRLDEGWRSAHSGAARTPAAPDRVAQ